ncbi:MAG: class I tRNA ligase family protein [Gemmatimonadales bacterium]
MTRSFPLWPDGPADGLETGLLATWKSEGLFRAVERHRAGSPPFVFFEGPPTANGRPGIHHIFSRTIKDLFCRFRSMQGREVTRIAGWDTHGLPVEIEVEKRLKLSGKKDIEAFGVEEFNRLCRESVFTYQADWESLSDRIGYWLDYDRPTSPTPATTSSRSGGCCGACSTRGSGPARPSGAALLSALRHHAVEP